jgi:hypothetical protein
VPDLGDQLVAALERLNDVLIALAVDEEDTAIELPAELAHGRALAAFEHIWAAVRPTQGRVGGPRPLGPDGRYEHTPLAPVTVHTEDLAVLGAAAAALGAGVSRHDPMIENVLLEFVRIDRGRAETAADVVDEVARLHGLLDLAWTDDAQLLHNRLAAASAGVSTADVVLTPAEEAAYRRTVDRINAMWSIGSDIDQFRY